ncbi:hypothetical protein DRW07_11665 [Alteromonas sediminis]|uniref:Lipoprotein n=1 Tax=Alteromonas sediminis TaxID=2259342 RepID=A0A3N5Y247_9ALTE|nr:hypothetical protein [Alteromonas sediminis]RPJ66726.1 hypothetical protein DRW07_11665 [Alteromonas sediminis]
MSKRITLIKGVIFSAAITLVSGCGTSHLNCDTPDNQERLVSALNELVSDYLVANAEKKGIALAENPSYPAFTVTSFNQHIIDINAKKCDYIVKASFPATKAVQNAIPVSVVFRSTGINGQTHELNEFTVDPSDAVRLGIAAVKNAEQAKQ